MHKTFLERYKQVTVMIPHKQCRGPRRKGDFCFTIYGLHLSSLCWARVLSAQKIHKLLFKTHEYVSYLNKAIKEKGK